MGYKNESMTFDEIMEQAEVIFAEKFGNLSCFMCKIFWFWCFASFLYIRMHFKAIVLRFVVFCDIHLRKIYLKDNLSISEPLHSLCFSLGYCDKCVRVSKPKSKPI